MSAKGTEIPPPSPSSRSTPGVNHHGLPPLNSGDRLSRAEFARRYDAHPEMKKAELVEGVVYVVSPVRFEQHGRPHSDIVTCIGVYRASALGVSIADTTTVRLDFENEVQPDALVRLDRVLGGRSQITDDDYIAGPPELIVEIAASSAAYDLHDKRRVYARNGVQEYLVIQMYEQQVDWFTLDEGVYAALSPNDQGMLRSQVFPGLWLQPAAIWSSDLAALLAVLQAGRASPEHTTFVEQLRARLDTMPGSAVRPRDAGTAQV